MTINGTAEWLEPDGLGGYACGTVDGIRTRRYHAVLVSSLRPPIDRVVLVNGFDVWVETAAGEVSLASHRYLPDVIHPDGTSRIVDFRLAPWPRWTFRLDDGTEIVHEITVPRDSPVALASWRLSVPPRRAPDHVRLLVRPLLSCRDAHTLHLENPSFRFEAEEDGELVHWHPYFGIPGVSALSNGEYTHGPTWYRGFLYTAERERGLDSTEDLASPGVFRWDLAAGEAALVLTTDSFNLPAIGSATELLRAARRAEADRRAGFPNRLLLSADAYLVKRGAGRTILAGYPWSTDWGRDTFVALRGLCLASGRLDEARDILLEWTGSVSEGMLPSYFADREADPHFTAVDASLWYIVSVYEYLGRMKTLGRVVPAADRAALGWAVNAILAGYFTGTRFGVRVEEDGLLAAGEPGHPLTWMNSCLGEWVVTPRIGKPVEVQALWLNALRIGCELGFSWQRVLERGLSSFPARFWYAGGGYLHDVVDVDHRAGSVDSAFRPNQIFAVGGLPFPLLEEPLARRIVDVVESRLWTPLGLRTLAPGTGGYIGRYEGGVRQRDAAAHQGTAWPWLLGPFIEAWVRARGDAPAARAEARRRFLEPLLELLDAAGLGHLSEMADGDPPHTPRGAPFQAWSLGELIRVASQVLAEEPRPQVTADPHTSNAANV